MEISDGDENAGNDSNDNAEDDDDDDGDDSNSGKFTQIADPIQGFPIQPAHCSIRFDDNQPSYLCS